MNAALHTEAAPRRSAKHPAACAPPIRIALSLLPADVARPGEPVREVLNPATPQDLKPQETPCPTTTPSRSS
jgi:hypothetical protein